MNPSPVSLLPPGLTASLRRDELVDLLRYLSSLGKESPSAKTRDAYRSDLAARNELGALKGPAWDFDSSATSSFDW